MDPGRLYYFYYIIDVYSLSYCVFGRVGSEFWVVVGVFPFPALCSWPILHFSFVFIAGYIYIIEKPFRRGIPNRCEITGKNIF